MAEGFHLCSTISVLLEDFGSLKSRGFADSIDQTFCEDCTCVPAKPVDYSILL